jgi:hypothetical protein
MKEVGPKEVTHNSGNILKHVESSVNMVWWEFGIAYLDVGIAEHSIFVVIPLRLLLVRRNIIS